jgi:hypothetical protein
MWQASRQRQVWRWGLWAVALALLLAGSANAAPRSSALVPPQGPAPPRAVDIDSIANGCGGGKYNILIKLQNVLGDTSFYHDSTSPLDGYEVDFREACKLHDAGYSGAYVWDAINGQWYDYFGKTKEDVDKKFLADMRKLCVQQIPRAGTVAIADCKARGGTLSNGAESRYNFVRDHGTGFRVRPSLNGRWAGTHGSCGSTGPWHFNQSGRTITATWAEPSENGHPGYKGVFSGTLISYDPTQTVPPPRNDEVKGTLTVVTSAGVTKSYKVEFELMPSGVVEHPTLLLQ